MAEINNSLALGVKNDAPDIGKTLLTAGQIKEMQAKTALEEASTEQTQQNVDYNAFQQQQNGGYRAEQANTLAETAQKKAALGGSIGNIMVNDPSKSGVKQAIDLAKKAGIPIDPDTEKHLLSAPPEKIAQYGKNLQAYGQPSTSSIEQSPGGQQQRAYGRSSGEVAGQTGGGVPAIPTAKPMTQPQVDHAVSSRTNADGSPRVLSLNGNVPDQPGAPVNPLANKGVTEAQNAERTGNAQKNVEEYVGYKTSAQNSRTVKMTLRSLQDDAERVYTGKGATNKGDAQKWILAASNIPGVGSLVKHFAGDQSDPVSAIENIRKNIGIISRQAVGDIGERSAAALESVQNSLPSEEMSSKGLKQATSQMMAIEDFKQARLQAATAWKSSHNGSLDGFADDWSQHMGPAPFVMARLPKEEQAALRDRLRKSPEGKRTEAEIDKQLAWGAKHGLDGVID